jgi:hypothetical protein
VVSTAAHEEGQPSKPSCIDRSRYVVDVLGSYNGQRIAHPDREMRGPCFVVVGACGEHFAIHA